MAKPSSDVPAWLWISDSLVVRPGGNHAGRSKIAWTPELERRGWAMHSNGDSWNDVSQMLLEQTEVRMSARRVGEYLSERFNEEAV